MSEGTNADVLMEVKDWTVWHPEQVDRKVIKPVYEKMSEKHPTVAFGKVDVDENSDSAANFEISAVPTFIVFDGKTPIEKFSGADAGLLEKHVVDLEGR